MGKPVRGAGYQQRRLGGRIKEAYRDKVKRYHPDACEKENAEELFKRVKHAYETIQPGGSADTGSGQGTSRSHRDSRTDGYSVRGMTSGQRMVDGSSSGSSRRHLM